MIPPNVNSLEPQLVSDARWEGFDRSKLAMGEGHGEDPKTTVREPMLEPPDELRSPPHER